jgi:hypothetical protein
MIAADTYVQAPPPTLIPSGWMINDIRLAASILGTCDESIIRKHKHHLGKHIPGRARAVHQALEAAYGVMGNRTILELGMDLVRDRCQEGGGLGVWLETFLERRRVLDDAKFTAEDMAVVALWQGLPPRFEPQSTATCCSATRCQV